VLLNLVINLPGSVLEPEEKIWAESVTGENLDFGRSFVAIRLTMGNVHCGESREDEEEADFDVLKSKVLDEMGWSWFSTDPWKATEDFIQLHKPDRIVQRRIFWSPEKYKEQY